MATARQIEVIMPKVALLTPSYNKPQYVLDGVKSIVAQTEADWVYYIVDNSTDGTTRTVLRDYLASLPSEIREKIFYEEIDFTPEQRNSFYVPSWIANLGFKKMNADLIFYMSDDDYMEPNCFEKAVDWFNRNPDKSAMYFKMGVKERWGENFVLVKELPLNAAWGKTFAIPGGTTPDCTCDGGQVFIRKEALDQLEYPYFEETRETSIACHCDGIFLNKIARKFPIYPIDTDALLGHHRITKISTWCKSMRY